MAYKSSALALFMLACIASSAMAKSSDPKLSHAASAVSEAALAVDEFLPCLEALKGLEGCVADILKAVFRLPLGASCCQVINNIAKNCLPAGFPLTQVVLPSTLTNCITAPAPPARG
ncbi:Uncharacterized protein Adt_12678 [Abeliophyllum distichum]|uniref:Prolamin-like domain-containing protein n=1 Tax=Abeliophyllum distichum TaxID=126358 RepID=A0ABD1USE1_9LAMI